VNRPSFFVAGHSKSGTTALAEFLGQHPQLFVCSPMEPNYFCPSWCRAPGPPSMFHRRSEAEYLELFAPAEPGQLCGEASAVYLYSPEAAGLIARFEPAARIIMIFREPVDFLRSYHLQLLKNVAAEGETVRDLGEAIRLEPERRAGRRLPSGCLIPEMLEYSTARIRYDEHFDRFADRFPATRILPLVYDDFRRDNAATVRRVFSFLGVDPDFSPVLEDHNTGGQSLRSRRLQAALHRASHAGGAAGRLRAALPRRLRQRALDAGYRLAFEPAPQLDPELVAELRAKAAPHVAALGERLGRPLPAEWGYEAQVGAA
jgi:Sulfotransferase domain